MMERYQCHKIVEAGEINHYNSTDGVTGGEVVLEGGEVIQLNGPDYERIGKMAGNKHGYLVRYEDGYLSWSPKKVFEDGYRRLP